MLSYTFPRLPSSTTMAALRPQTDDQSERSSVIRRSWHALSALSPFSSSALASLPKKSQRPVRYPRADAIPDTDQDEEGQRPAVRDYHAISSVPEQVRVPKKILTSVKVEGKVWFANERSPFPAVSVCHKQADFFLAWIAWLNTAVLIGTLSLALFNASKDQVARNFAYTYAVISLGVAVRFTFFSRFIFEWVC
jgi:hypothetical protein